MSLTHRYLSLHMIDTLRTYVPLPTTNTPTSS